MARIVFVLGAGASLSAVVPVMLNFLDFARQVVESSDLSISKEDFETVFHLRDELERHARSTVHLNNLESISTWWR
jgi:hypothetical protein